MNPYSEIQWLEVLIAKGKCYGDRCNTCSLWASCYRMSGTMIPTPAVMDKFRVLAQDKLTELRLAVAIEDMLGG
jgi:hypothetical protein